MTISVKPIYQYSLRLPTENEVDSMWLLTSHPNLDEDPKIRQDAIDHSPALKVTISRAEYHGMQLTTRAALAIVEISEGVPGRIVQLLHGVYCFPAAQEAIAIGRAVTFPIICEVFGHGLPSNEAYQEQWAAQKREDNGNHLDDHWVWIASAKAKSQVH